jgi:TetR/AcrR family transcriptional regulator, ethionamide resistance regulator
VTSAEQSTRHAELRETTRGDILGAADEFLREHPYRELSVEALVTRSGFTRTAFYRRFDDVTDLVLALMTDLGGELYGVAERWLQDAQADHAAGLGFQHAARTGLRAVVDFFSRNGPLIRAFGEGATTDERIERAYNGFLDRFTEITAFGLHLMVREGQIDPLDPWPVARALNLMNERYLLGEFGRPSQGNPELALKTLETVWLRSLAPKSRAEPEREQPEQARPADEQPEAPDAPT